MDTVIIRAEKRAVSALIKEIKRREAYHSLEKHRGRQLLKVWFLKELWRRVYRIASKMAEEDTFPESLHSVYLAFAGLSKDGCIITKTPAWVQIKLTNHTYWISQSSGCLYIRPAIWIHSRSRCHQRDWFQCYAPLMRIWARTCHQ